MVYLKQFLSAKFALSEHKILIFFSAELAFSECRISIFEGQNSAGSVWKPAACVSGNPSGVTGPSNNDGGFTVEIIALY